ncbi:hypothetical protein L5515_000999 [Caenorhabditis briggsae]|uniref:Saposin B-type domain-containing protein n=1 Tax=Caenorhabditis briggsae TaxID=6238 RepID=A0AAE9E3J5_CAEBR|nr:hypothetical protein L5515_000999 [Caenorhabditis briggsae]
MKFLTVVLLLAALVIYFQITQVASQAGGICMFCSGLIQVPQAWSHAQELLKYGCGQLGEAKSACVELVNAADLTSPYPKMYPYIIQLKDIGCASYCRT